MAKQRILIPHRIFGDALALLQEQFDVDYRDTEEFMPQEEFLAALRDVDGLMVYSRHKINADVLAHAPQLKVVSNIAVGYDNLDLAALTARGILATNTPDVLTETTADLTFGLLMAAGRRLAEADRFVKQGQWEGWFPSLMLGKDIHGATMGIIGLGRIGQAVARRGAGFGMNILYHNRSRRPELEQELGVQYASLDELLEQSDYVVVLVPLSAESRHVIGERELGMMKRDALLINAARGAVIDEQALIHALQEGRIAGAGLDVFEQEPVAKDNPLLKMSNVVTLPHIGSASLATRSKMATKAAQNMIAGLTGRKPENLVNPDAWRDN
ncbi:MAG TPA: D-glycerate dehydrogenase [Bacilli bacterium]|nr:D-glycerate dehydrogenase [Bacilli bacterium]